MQNYRRLPIPLNNASHGLRQQRSIRRDSKDSFWVTWKRVDPRLSSTITLFLASLIFGCRGEVPAPAPALPAESSEKQSTAKHSETSASDNSRTPDVEADQPFELEADFRLLTLEDFEQFGAESETWKSLADGFACSGKPRGYLYSKQPYQDFTWRFDYRFPRPEKLKDDSKFKGNTGFLVYITGEHKLWPICLEVQGKHIQMAAVKENGGAQPVTVADDDSARQRARAPVGQWNAIEIVSKEGELRVSLNGIMIAQSKPDFLSEGLIGVQSEDHPFEVRRMRIRPD